MRYLAAPVTTAALLIGLQLAPVATAYADTLTLRAECRKKDSGGCTAAYSTCASAPAGKYIKPSSFSGGSIANHWGKNATCRTAQASGHVTYVVPGSDIEAQLATSMCASLHIESGSGLANLGQVAFVDCSYDVVYGDLP